MNKYINKFYNAIRAIRHKTAKQNGKQYIKVKNIDEIKNVHTLDYHDLSELDLREYRYLFDYAPDVSMPTSGVRGWTTNVIWPAPDKMPDGFNPTEILEQAKSTVYKPITTGKGINIAVIDTPLDVDNPEYADNIKFFQGPLSNQNVASNKHSGMVMGHLVGKSTGMAPDANIYYFTRIPYQDRKKLNKETINVLRNVIKFNREQKPENKIHILSCSWGGKQKYSPEITVLLNQLEKDGVKIILCGSDYVKEATLSGRDFMPCNNPDMTDIQPDVQNAGNELLHALNMSFNMDKVIGIPTNMRTTPLESNGWQYRISGGESSSAPYIAGVYACALQGNQLFMTRPNWQQELNDILKSTAIEHPVGGKMINPFGIRNCVSEIVKQMKMDLMIQKATTRHE